MQYSPPRALMPLHLRTRTPLHLRTLMPWTLMSIGFPSGTGGAAGDWNRKRLWHCCINWIPVQPVLVPQDVPILNEQIHLRIGRQIIRQDKFGREVIKVLPLVWHTYNKLIVTGKNDGQFKRHTVGHPLYGLARQRYAVFPR